MSMAGIGPDLAVKAADARRLIAILYADMVGYCRLISTDDAGTLRRLRALRQALIDPAIQENGGRLVQTGGDSLLVAFDSVEGAVRCAARMQRQVPVLDGDQPPDRRIRFRIGINLGDVIPDGTDLYGDSVNIAARLEAASPVGGVCVSRSVREQVHGRLDLTFEPIGELTLKNIARPVEAFVLRLDPAAEATTADGSVSLAPEEPGSLTPPDGPSIAVLPFSNLSSDPEQEYFADGMVEEITTALAKVRWLFVVARNSSFTYKGRATDVRQVGRELGVGFVLEGSVRRSVQQVRITAQLIDASSGNHIWAERFDAVLEHILELQDRIAQEVAGQLQPELRRSEIARVNRRHVQSLNAYDLYLRALGRFHQHTAPAICDAIALLRQTLTVDPAYAAAAALIGECRLALAAQGQAVTAEERAESIDLARLAIDLGNEDPDTLGWSSLTLSNFAREHAVAEAVADRALVLNPSSATGWYAKGFAACLQERNEVAVAAFKRGLRLSPLDPLRGYFEAGIALASLHQGRFEDASHWATEALSKLPDYLSPMRINAAACAHLDRLEEAREWLGRLLQRQPALTIRTWRAATTSSGSGRDRFEAGLRRAGLPEG
jgi:TolB-like protein/class 3 adenylate cyclase